MASERHEQGGVATIDHQEVHVDISKSRTNASGNQNVVTGQSSVSYSNNQSGTPIVFQKPPDKKDKPKDFVVTSCFTILLCNFVFGLFGYHYAVKANHAWQLGDEPQFRRHRKKALICVVSAIVMGIITYVLAITLFFTLADSKFT